MLGGLSSLGAEVGGQARTSETKLQFNMEEMAVFYILFGYPDLVSLTQDCLRLTFARTHPECCVRKEVSHAHPCFPMGQQNMYEMYCMCDFYVNGTSFGWEYTACSMYG